MKKRILSIILAVCMVAALVPVIPTTASAADTCTCLTRCTDSYTDADCPVCSAAISGCLGRNLWGEIKDADGLQNAMNLSATYSTVYFILGADLTLTNAITVPENANALIDLNGHTLSGDQEHGIFEVYGKLTVVDTKGTGKMTDAGGAFRICGGYVLMTGGTIENCTTFGGVYIKQGGTFKMTGGTLKNNTSYAGVLWYGEKYPASIYSSTSKDGTVIIDGAAQVLCCDQADCDHFGSICIYSNQTTLRVDGGTIKGGIYTNGTSIITSSRTGTGEGTAIQGKVENGGTISGGTYDDEVKNEAAGTISGGSFAGKVTNTGSISGGTFHSEVDNQGTISGGTYSETSVVKNTGTISGGTFLGTVESENGTIEDSANVSVRFVNEAGETIKTVRVLRGQKIALTDLPEIDPTQYGYAKVKYTVGGAEYRDNSEFTDAVRYTEDETVVTVTLISPIAYTITYNLDGGFVSSSNPFESNPTEYFSTSDDFTLQNPTKDGYVFTGWGGTGLEGTNNMTVTIPKGSTGDRTYTAYYMKRPSGDLSSNYSYTVVYDTQGGSPVAPKTVWLGDTSKVEVLDGASTTRAGYMFAGWYCGSKRIALQGTTVADLADRADNGVITITAHWREKLEVSFNTAAQEYTYDGAEQAFEIRDTTLDGFQVTYRQNGNTVAAPINAGSYDVIVTRDETSTHKAVNETIPGGLVIKPQEITVTIGDISDQTYTGKAIEPAITVSDDTNEIPASEYTVAYTGNRNAGTATVTVTAKAGGNYTFTQATQTFTIQKKSITPTIAMAGYGYGTDPGCPEVSGNEGGGAVSVWYSTYDDIGTNTAHRQFWDVAAIDGTTLNAGTYYMMAEVAESQNYTAGTSPVITFKVMAGQYAAPAAPTLDGSTVTISEADRSKALEYSLNGGAWTDVPALGNGSFVPAGLAENTGFTLSLRQKASADGNYAASDAVGCFSVAYNANGGTGTVPCAYANSGSSVTVAAGGQLQRTGYTFAGWNTEADGSGTAYAAGSAITTAATLYAQWTINQYTITFDTDGGTEIDPITLDYGEAVTAPENPTKTGYTFAGWDQEIPDKMPANNMTIKAKWTIIPATAPTVETLDGLTLTYGYTEGSISVTATPVEGHTITGYQWYSNTSASNEGGTLLTGATDSSYTIPTGKTAGTTEYYYCVVTTKRTDNSEQASATSNVATVTVNKAPVSFRVTENTLTYDGNDRTATVIQTVGQTPPIGNAFTVCYKQNGNPVTPKDAGTYEVWVTITSDNFKFDGQTDTVRGMKVGELTINPRPVTVSGITAADKTYDGKSAATLDCSNAVISDVCSDDSLSVTATGTFSDPSASESKTVHISDLTLDGEDKANYVLANDGQQATAIASITARDITVTITPGGGCYGGITPATAKLNGLVEGEDTTVTLTYTGTANDGTDYNSTTVPTEAGNYTVTASISDTNYNLTGTVTEAFVVTKAEQTAPDAPTVKSKTYYSVTLVEIPDANGAKAQYSIDGGETWQDSPVFTDLKPNTEYRFVARYGETDNYLASLSSEAVAVKTSKVPASTYPPTVEQPDEGGSVTTSTKNPTAGSKVTITPTPDKGYEVDKVIVTDHSGNPVEVKDNGDGTYSFTQPAGKVTISVTFAEIQQPGGNPFVDVPSDAYYYDAVLWAAENGITGGVDDTHFAPNAPCTRAQSVTFLWRAAGCPTPQSSEMPFTDVAEGSYYYDAVLWAVENGITKGTSDTTFDPDATCNRGQIVTFLWRSQNSPAAGSGNPFDDVKADDYYADAVLWAVKEEVTNGTSDTTFSPADDCTRAQIVTFLFRCLGGE